MKKLAIIVIIIQTVALLFFICTSLGLAAGWYISYQSWQEYVQPRKEVFYDGLHYMCLLVGGKVDTCQRSTERFYLSEAFENRYLFGVQDWEKTQGKEAGEVR